MVLIGKVRSKSYFTTTSIDGKGKLILCKITRHSIYTRKSLIPRVIKAALMDESIPAITGADAEVPDR